MKKLALELDGLRVESFDTGGARNAGGTVRGHAHGGEWDKNWENAANSEGCSDGCTHSCASGARVCCA